MDSFKQRFQLKIAELCENKHTNALSFTTKEEYNKKLKRILQLKANANMKKEKQDYKLLRNCFSRLVKLFLKALVSQG